MKAPEGKLDPEQARGFWFDENGLLVKTYFQGIETRRLEVENFAGAQVARRIDVLKDGKLAIKIRITEISISTGSTPEEYLS